VLQVKVFERDGKSPFLDWLRGLRDTQARARVRTRIDRLQLGNLGDHRALGGGLFELKIDWGPGYRVYLGRLGETWVLLLSGGDKKTQQRDIDAARRDFQEYLDAQQKP
jgi:putative addiction module killer protein